jgi:hypothetical protein
MFKKRTQTVKSVNEKERAMKKVLAKKYVKNARKTKVLLKEIAMKHNHSR